MIHTIASIHRHDRANDHELGSVLLTATSSLKIAAEARQRGVQQGVLIEEAWVLYERENKPACEAATTC